MTGHERTRSWSLLSNHGRVLAVLAATPDVRIADLAAAVGLRERSTHRIVHDLVDAGYVEQRKIGRRNEYRVLKGSPELLAHLVDT